MHATIILAWALTAQPAEPLKLAITTFNVVELSAERATFYADYFADQLARHGVQVVTPRDIAAVLGLERERQLLGCKEEDGCLAEVASALGVDGLVLGDIARIGGIYQVNLRVVAPDGAKRLTTYGGSVRSDEATVFELARAARVVAEQTAQRTGRSVALVELPLESKPPPAPQGRRSLWWIPAGVGVVALGAGGVGFFRADGARQRLETETFGVDAGRTVLAEGQRARTFGYVGLGVGVAALGAAGAMMALSPATPVAPVAAVGPNGGSVGLVGVIR